MGVMRTENKVYILFLKLILTYRFR